MNPYDFVRINWSKVPDRRPPLFWSRFTGLAGRIEGRIVAETALLVKGSDEDNRPLASDDFVRNGARQEIIPGSSLKGLFRSVVEIVGNGCWRHYTGRYRTFPERRGDKNWLDFSKNLPREFYPCHDVSSLCVACRLFGFSGRQDDRRSHHNVFAGAVSFDDAVCVERRPFQAGYLPPLMPPKPRHRAWYVPDEQRLAGRKVYFHQRAVRLSPSDPRGTGRRVQPLGPGSAFRFKVQFSQVDLRDWPFLLYALVLEDNMRHKLGYGKPVGLGTVRIELTRLEIYDMAARYRSSDFVTVYEGDPLRRYIDETIAPIVNDTQNLTLNDLRRIWAWPPKHAHYAYPTREWFARNPRASIEETGGQ